MPPFSATKNAACAPLPLSAVNAVRCGRRLTGRLPAAFFRLPVTVFVGTDPAQKAGGLQLFHLTDDGADGKAGLLRQFALRDEGMVFDAVQNSLLTGG